jgi:hypothetical protein
MAYELIETITLATTGQIQFSSIPNDGAELIMKMNVRSSSTSSYQNVRINGSSASDYWMLNLEGTGTTVFADGPSFSQAGYSSFQVPINKSSTQANTFGNAEMRFLEYAGGGYKEVFAVGVTEDEADAAQQRVSGGFWKQNAAITSISLTTNMVAGSTVSLYKVY